MITIVQSPDPVLNTVCEPCDLDDRGLKKLAKQMAKAMYKNDGCGIAAPQVGVTKRLVVIDCDQDETGAQNPLVLVNLYSCPPKAIRSCWARGVCPVPVFRCPLPARPLRAYAISTLMEKNGKWKATGCSGAVCSTSLTISTASPCSSGATP